MSASCLLDALAARPASAPVLRDSLQCLSAGEILERVSTLAERLHHCKVVAVLADNSADWVIADLATLQLGAVHLPIPTFFSPAQMCHVLALTGADAVLTDQVARVDELQLGFVTRWTLATLTLMQRPTQDVALPAGCAKISFTSGSTGNPKGVCLSAAGLLATAQAVQERLAPLHINRHLAVLPLSLLLENTAGIYAALLSGAQIHLPSLATLGWRGMAGFDPALLQTCVNANLPHSVILVPELLKAWLLYLGATGQKAAATLTFVAVGGARVDRALLARARAVGIPAYEGYGLTECGSVVSLNTPGDDGHGVGRPLAHAQLRVADDELHVTSAAFLGYVGTAENPSARLKSPVGPAEFATGDLGHLDQHGHLHLSGRRKNLLITSYGRNISPEWVEASLLAHPAVAQAAVFGDAKAWLSAVLVPMATASAAQLADAMAQCNASLPDYARIGGWLCSEPFTLANGLATGNGRPRRNAIAAYHAEAIEALYHPQEITHVVL